MRTSDQIDQISKAISIAQGEMRPASKSTENPYFKSKYSSLAQVMDSIREPFAKNNLCVFQDVSSTPNGIAISTRVCHASGQWLEFGPMEVPVTKKDAQGVGSATSYGKRYSLSAAVGVVSEEEDDDGEKSINRNLNLKDEKPKSPKKEDVPSPVIDAEKRKILHSLSKHCDPEYIKKIHEYLNTLNIVGFDNVTEKVYVKIFKGMNENAEVNLRG